MATEPTLGQRILDAADRYAEAYGWWLAETEEDEAPGPMYARQRATRETVRTLAARANAAERGMLAMIALGNSLKVSHSTVDDNWGLVMDLSRLTEYVHVIPTDEEEEAYEALAAWRAITEGGVTR